MDLEEAEDNMKDLMQLQEDSDAEQLDKGKDKEDEDKQDDAGAEVDCVEDPEVRKK